MSNGNGLPNPLVLPLTTIFGGECAPAIANELKSGNTFEAPFDTSFVAPPPSKAGELFLETRPAKNFTAASRVRLANEGLAGKLAFMSTGTTQATIYGQQYTVNRVFVIGKPDASGGYDWTVGMIVGSCQIIGGSATEEMAALLQG